MVNCAYASKWMLNNPIEVRTCRIPGLLYARFMRTRAEKAVEPMLLAWFDKKSGNFSRSNMLRTATKPSWLVYAEACGGHIAVDINDEEYVFVYRDVEPDALTH